MISGQGTITFGVCRGDINRCVQDLVKHVSWSFIGNIANDLKPVTTGFPSGEENMGEMGKDDVTFLFP